MVSINNAARDIPAPILDGNETLACKNSRCKGPVKKAIVALYPNVAIADQLTDDQKILFCSTQCFDSWCLYTRANTWDDYVCSIEPGN